MRRTLVLVAIGVLGCRRAATPPSAELRALVVKDLPSALASMAGRPPLGEWQCAERGSLLECNGGAEDALTVTIDSITAGAKDRQADVFLTAGGASAAHFGPNSGAAFIVQWRDTYEKVGNAWKRTAHNVMMIT